MGTLAQTADEHNELEFAVWQNMHYPYNLGGILKKGWQNHNVFSFVLLQTGRQGVLLTAWKHSQMQLVFAFSDLRRSAWACLSQNARGNLIHPWSNGN